MSDESLKDHQASTEKFIALANELTQGGLPAELVSHAMMTASGLFATFTIAGNEGGLNPSGVDKVVDAYRQSLEHIQRVKEEQYGKQEG